MSAQEKITRKKSRTRTWIEALIIAACAAMFIRTFVIQAFSIPSSSMEDTLLIGDHLFVNRFVYGIQIPGVDGRFFPIRDPQRGDIIVFSFPEDEDLPPWKQRAFIKRIVGLPGETVEIRDKQLVVNGQPLDIPQAQFKDRDILDSGPRDNMEPLTVAQDHYFVLGDNRDDSIDSRFWGTVAKDKIKGPAMVIYWSWNGEAHIPRMWRIGTVFKNTPR